MYHAVWKFLSLILCCWEKLLKIFEKKSIEENRRKKERMCGRKEEEKKEEKMDALREERRVGWTGWMAGTRVSQSSSQSVSQCIFVKRGETQTKTRKYENSRPKPVPGMGKKGKEWGKIHYEMKIKKKERRVNKQKMLSVYVFLLLFCLSFFSLSSFLLHLKIQDAAWLSGSVATVVVLVLVQVLTGISLFCLTGTHDIHALILGRAITGLQAFTG